MFVIQVTNFAGERLFVKSIAKRYRLGYIVQILVNAKRFDTEQQANEAIANFKQVDESIRATFEVIPLSEAKP